MHHYGWELNYECSTICEFHMQALTIKSFHEFAIMYVLYLTDSLSDDTFVRTRRFYLPPSFRYIAWFLSIVIGFGSGFITVYYS